MSTISNINEFPASADADMPHSSLRVFALPLSLLLGGVILCLCAFAMPADVNNESAVIATSKPVSIEDVQLGWRVVGENPLGPEDNASEPNEQSWKKVVLQHRSEEGTLIEIEFLRPNAWFEKWRAEVGRTIDLSLSEPGKSGIAKVIAVDPCPEIRPGTGPVVTGLFRHVCEEGELVQVEVDADVEPIISTFNHQFWSETRNEFIQAADLQPSEQLLCANESLVSVKQITTVAGAKPVFNLETHNHHVYAVGVNGMLAHNMCATRKPDVDVDPRTPVGRKGQENDNNFVKNADGSPRNSPTEINGREFSGHAVDRMQERGLVPSVVENAIATGTSRPGNKPDTTVVEDFVNKVSVVLNKDNKVITIFAGVKGNR